MVNFNKRISWKIISIANWLSKFIPIRTSFARSAIQTCELFRGNRALRLSQILYGQLRRCYRFVPEKPTWKRFDVNPTSPIESDASDSDSSMFRIPESALPPRTELSSDTIKLLERLSLVEFGTEKCLSILEEAIRYADPLLTEQAFRGTTDNRTLTFENTEPILSLCEELYPDYSCPLAADEPIREDQANALAEQLFHLAPITWEGYVVAPPGNIALEPKGIDRSPTDEIVQTEYRTIGV